MTLTAVLFVGGKSRRMGADKATLKLEDGPLWARQIRMLRELQPTALQLSTRTRPEWCPPDIETVLDEPPSRGPLTGLAAVLGAAGPKTSHVLALAIDLPQMTAVHLRKLWSLAEPGCGVMPLNGDYFEPLCAIYPMEAAGAVRAALAGGDVSLQNVARVLLDQHRLRTYSVDQAERPLYHNANTPEDW